MPDVLDRLPAEIAALPPGALVGIDGVDGSGKTTFADELAARLVDAPAVLHLDDFLNPPEIRHARGRRSPEGFWLDTYDYARIQAELTRARSASALMIVEGMFLHRDELSGAWDLSVLLDVPFGETARRMSLRDGSDPDPEHESMRRYVGGQRLYFATARPWERATHVIDNADPSARRIIPGPESSAAREV